MKRERLDLNPAGTDTAVRPRIPTIPLAPKITDTVVEFARIQLPRCTDELRSHYSFGGRAKSPKIKLKIVGGKVLTPHNHRPQIFASTLSFRVSRATNT